MSYRNITLRLGTDGVLELGVPPKKESPKGWGASEDLERLIDVLIAAVKDAGGTVTQKQSTEVPI